MHMLAMLQLPAALAVGGGTHSRILTSADGSASAPEFGNSSSSLLHASLNASFVGEQALRGEANGKALVLLDEVQPGPSRFSISAAALAATLFAACARQSRCLRQWRPVASSTR